MDIKGKSKDNLNARKDLAIICNRPELQVDERRPNVMPKAVYTLTKDHKRKVCEWVKCLRFPNGYASNLSRYVDMRELRLYGMKSHECHIFMQKLIPVAFREMVPEHVWSALTEVSLMFQVLCSTTLDIRKVQELEDSVAYRWMYPFERFLHELKKKVKNNAHVEASIVEAYIVEEIGEHERISRDIFNHPGRPSGALKNRYATGQERYMIETYVLCNSEVAAPYYESFLNELYKTYSPDDPLIDQLVTIDFVGWFKSRVESELQNIEDDLLRSLYRGPKELVKTWPCYFVNGFNFHTKDHNIGKLTMNYRKDEPFILAQQACQVYYTEYPSMKRDKIDWMAVCKTKARRVESHWTNVAYQIDEEVPVLEVNTNNQTYDLHDPDGLQLIVDLTSAMQHGVGTSRHDEDDEDEDDEDSFDDYETNEESEEQDNN
ncbi:hypothetical protein Sango_2314700 [Sesamum angolense]|uniref:DUF4218 domain-containing protein n=1 Tax=Sesamum angolense TaxID=2727404 RepID=A0AAE2BLH2_9LAMI|nr:hypothetical protein Sango_2314700 [Sesamum angolense]